jgi:hypothetical protein
MRRAVALVVSSLLLVAGAAACGTSAGDDALTGSDGTETDGTATDELPSALDPATTEVVLAFTDSSVAPEYHRSYTLTVNAQGVHVVVDSYGDVLHDVTEDVPDDQWSAFVADLPERLAALPDPEPDDGCAGGTGTALTVTEGGDEVYAGEDHSCSQSFQGPAQALVAPFGELVDLGALRETS